MPALTPETTRARRDHIMAAAMRCFAHAGYRGTSIRDICNEADLSIGGLYAHFSGKEEILIAMAKKFHDQREALYAEGRAQAPSADPATAVAEIFRTMVKDYGTAQGDRERHADIVMLGEALSIPLLKSVLVETDVQHITSFKALLDTANPDAAGSSLPLANLLAGSLFGLIILSAYHENFDCESYIAALRDLLSQTADTRAAQLQQQGELQ